MAARRWTPVFMMWFLGVQSALAQPVGEPDALFESHEVLDVRISAPLTAVLSERSLDQEIPATFEFTNSAGEAVVLDIQMRTRGRFRRSKEVCTFPPIRLNFKKSQTKDTILDKQDKVKLVTHCRSGSRYQQVLLREYTAYRIYNILTDISFRVRLLRINYVDSKGKQSDNVQFGFIIEHRDRLAKRLNMSVADVSKTSINNLEPAYANLASMFHYLLGNTDYSPVMGVAGEVCCHNHVLFTSDERRWLSVPYDFDQSGLIDAPHAGPNPRFRLKNVQQRLYRGRCIFNEHLPANAAHFKDKRADVVDLIETVPAVNKRNRRSMARYIDKFYETLDSERRVQGEFIKKCI